MMFKVKVAISPWFCAYHVEQQYLSSLSYIDDMTLIKCGKLVGPDTVVPST